MTDAPPEPPRVYTVAQLATILQVDPRIVRHNTKGGSWPHLKLGPKTVRFTDNHLTTILATTEAAPPPPQPTGRRTRRKP